MAEGTLTPSAIPAAPASPQPAPVDLRPLSTSELIDRSFSLYRAHFTGLLLLALLCQSGPLFGQILVTSLRLNPTQDDVLQGPHAFLVKIGWITLITFVAQVLAFCLEVVIVFYVSDAYLGKLPSVKDAMRRFTGCVVATVWTCVLNRILIFLTFIFPALAIAGIFFYLLRHPDLGLMSLIGVCAAGMLVFLASVIPVLVVFMRLMLTIPALALEGYSGWQSVKRSSALVRFDPGLGIFYWGEMRLSFLLLPLFIIELMILSLTSLPLVLHQISEAARHGSDGQIAPPPDSLLVLSQIMSFGTESLILPLYAIATTLFYYDIRIRREGFDLEFLAARLRRQG